MNRTPRHQARLGRSRVFHAIAATTLLTTAMTLAGCAGPAAPTHPAIPSLGPRPSSPATVSIVEPANGARVSGETAAVELRLDGATIVPETTTELRPDEGHVHLYVDGVLVSMNYGLEQDVPVEAGSHVLKAEFVAADHAPFNPRIWSPEVIFTVTP